MQKGIGLHVDVGDGFDLAQARKKNGLGLISMEKRVRAVNGVFHIQPEPGQGTRVEVRVRLKTLNAASTIATG